MTQTPPISAEQVEAALAAWRACTDDDVHVSMRAALTAAASIPARVIPLYASPPEQELTEKVEPMDRVEAAARAMCAVKGINPDAAHYGTSDRDVQDGTFPDGGPFYFGWRNQIKYVAAVIAALEQKP